MTEAASNNTSKKMSSSKFSEFVMSMDDLYDMALRNGFYLPKRKSAAINEIMLFNILQGHYWCPKFQEIRLQSCLKPPMKEVLFSKILEIC